MQKSILLALCAFACTWLLPLQGRSDPPSAGPVGTPPPEIYHVVTSALCARLHEQVRPAVAMILENDQKIAKSPPLFKKYQRGVLTASNDTSGFGDSMYNSTPETSMALQQMSYLVIPIARNLIAAQTMLDDPKLQSPTGSPDDDATLARVKAQLLQTVADQSASLDLINGFVQTLQMGEIQHAGEEYLGAIQGSDLSEPLVKATPNQYQDPNTPGLSPNPYAFDVTTIPGLAVGYNPLSKITDALQYLRDETGKHEDAAGKTIAAALSNCPK